MQVWHLKAVADFQCLEGMCLSCFSLFNSTRQSFSSCLNWHLQTQAGDNSAVNQTVKWRKGKAPSLHDSINQKPQVIIFISPSAQGSVPLRWFPARSPSNIPNIQHAWQFKHLIPSKAPQGRRRWLFSVNQKKAVWERKVDWKCGRQKEKTVNEVERQGR